MFKLIIISCFAISAVLAAPKPSHFAAPHVALAPAVAPAIVTAQSSQVVARNYNALVAPVAPLVAPAPVIASAPIVAHAPVLAPAPYVASAPAIAASYRVATPFLY